MASIQSPGIGSSLDINSIVSQLVAAEKTPTTNRLDAQEALVQAKISTLGVVKSSVSDFQTSIQALSSLSAFQSKTATVGNDSLFSTTVSSVAKAGQYSVEVSQLAQAQKLASKVFTDTTSTIGTGTLHLNFGSYNADGSVFTPSTTQTSQDIVIGADKSSLQGIRDAVNSAGTGVIASILNDGTGNRLVFSAQSGAANSLQITASDDDGNPTNASGLSQLVFDPTTAGGAVKNMTETLSGKDAQLRIDGISISRPTNSVTGVLPGVTMDLKSFATNSPTTLTISENKTNISDAVNKFVTSFNALKGVLNKATQYDAATKKASLLTGDSAIRGFNSQIQRAMGGIVQGLSGNVRALADIGITSARDGTLTLDSAKLNQALGSNIDAFSALFATTGHTTDSLVAFNKGTSATKVGTYPIEISRLASQASYSNPVGYGVGSASDSSVSYVTGSSNSATVTGSYAVNITQLATQSTLSNNIGNGPFSIDATNNRFKIKVDGTQSGDLIMNGQSGLTGTQLAEQLQTRINADADLATAGRSVTVAYDSGSGALSFKSNQYGTSSSIEITNTGPGGAAIGLTLGSGSAAQNIAGTIGGVAANGAGNRLTGTGNASGLQVDINGGALGARGAVDFGKFDINASNNAFKVTVDGTQSGLITLNTQSGLTNTELALAMQTQINSDNTLKAAGRSVRVAFDTDTGNMVFKSTRVGSSSTIEVNQISSASAALGLSIKKGEDGADIVGTIGGVAAVSSGNKLTGVGDAEGLQVTVDGGTIGSRGTIGYSKGIAEQLNSIVTGFLATNGGLTQRVQTYNDQETSITAQRAKLATHLTTLEKDLRTKFNVMDGIVGSLKTTSDFLTQQLANLPSWK